MAALAMVLLIEPLNAMIRTLQLKKKKDSIRLKWQF